MWQFWGLFIIQILLFAAIPVIPAVILRVKNPNSAPWIWVISTIIGFLCLLPEIFFRAGWVSGQLFYFATFAIYFIPCSLPALYCVAFFERGRKIWLALIPAAVFWTYWFLQYCTFLGFIGAVKALVIGMPGDQSLMITYMCIAFEIWAFICVIITYLIRKRIVSRNHL